ncbi:hypothetical protein GIB67_012560 [Kingdonia uniflora]|uniref:AP-3 complex subunit delta n=1 Tax=Kingdonia uniflora TaxID=39325 RepID=A0A7J7NF15_9MAGN|nr:hypothetical protein GIB67_012560 [Kingdonia uniflora]
MSSSRFWQKKIGYLAASQSFNDDTDVILLITNQLRKDLTSVNEYEVSLALECLSVICTTDLARDLTPEIFTLLSSSKVNVKKKAVAVILRVFSKNPESVRVSFKRLVENLESRDGVVVSAVVGVFCELTVKDPGSYLPLAPEFYRVLVDSKNNWVLIKVLKIFAKLAPLEPRLAKRIVEPVCDHMRRTTAKSLMFECIRTVVTCLTEYESAVKIAVEKTQELLGDDDANLKYLGLHALSIIASKHLWAVEVNKEMVIKSLSDEDPNIKLESLRLMMEMVSESNVAEICKVLVNYALKSDPDFCNEILGSILLTCSRNMYEVVVDFDWYVSLLGEMSRNPHCQKGEEIERQLVDIGMRVKEVRLELVHVSRDLLIDPALLGNPFLHRILSAAAWVCGEYVEFSGNPFELIAALLQPRTNLLPPLIRAVYIQSSFKILVFCLHSFLIQSEESSLLQGENSLDGRQAEEFNPRFSNETEEEVDVANGGDKTADQAESFSASLEKDSHTHEAIVHSLNLVKMALGPLLGSDEVQVQERSRNVLGFVELIQDELSGYLVEKDGSLKLKELQASKLIEVMHDSFSEDLGPVSVTAQGRVPVPEGLVLEENLFGLDTICGDILLPTSSSSFFRTKLFAENEGVSSAFNLQKKEELEPSTESTSLLAEHRKRHGLYYLPSGKKEDGSNDYPPAHDPHSAIDLIDGAQDLLKLTDTSFVSKKKPNHSKSRPVVVKLDERDELSVSVAKPMNESRDNSLAGAIRDFILGEAQPTSSQNNPSDKSSRRRRAKEVAFTGEYVSQQPKENLGDASSPRRSKHHSQSKERHRTSKENAEGIEETTNKDKHKSYSHGRSKTRHRAEVPSNVLAQTLVIPDFLL